MLNNECSPLVRYTWPPAKVIIRSVMTGEVDAEVLLFRSNQNFHYFWGGWKPESLLTELLSCGAEWFTREFPLWEVFFHRESNLYPCPYFKGYIYVFEYTCTRVYAAVRVKSLLKRSRAPRAVSGSSVVYWHPFSYHYLLLSFSTLGPMRTWTFDPPLLSPRPCTTSAQ